ncbi:MAG: redoxin domain-containing protein [Verrucomicrobia bacterium]|jgi:peroxiredoxin|nr:redoxin domain-containing protein [Verrucomicrobiota bacterium]
MKPPSIHFRHLFFVTLLTGLITAAQAAPPNDAREVNPIEVGASIPAVSLTRADGSKVTLHDLTDESPAILIFYRGGWCPYCNRHLAALREIESDLRELGYRIHAISPDRPEAVARTVAKSEGEFNYTLYSDASAAVAKAFGLAFKVDAETYEKLMGYGIDLEAASGQEHHLLPVPAVYIVDTAGRVRFRYFDPNYKERLSAEALLNAAKAAQ